jgi:hypothetical protein
VVAGVLSCVAYPPFIFAVIASSSRIFSQPARWRMTDYSHIISHVVR